MLQRTHPPVSPVLRVLFQQYTRHSVPESHSLAARLRVHADLCLEEDLVDPELRDGPRVRVRDLRKLHGDALRELRELFFRSSPFDCWLGLQVRLGRFVQVADRAALVRQRAAVQLHRLQAGRRRLLGILAQRSVERAGPGAVRFLVAVYERDALGVDVAHYIFLLQLRRILLNLLREEKDNFNGYVVA